MDYSLYLKHKFIDIWAVSVTNIHSYNHYKISESKVN